jgi:hypothetical protein
MTLSAISRRLATSSFLRRPPTRLLQRHPDLHRQDAFVRPGEAVRGLFDRIFLDVGHDHVRARLGKRRRDTEADAGSERRCGSQAAVPDKICYQE